MEDTRTLGLLVLPGPLDLLGLLELLSTLTRAMMTTPGTIQEQRPKETKEIAEIQVFLVSQERALSLISTH